MINQITAGKGSYNNIFADFSSQGNQYVSLPLPQKDEFTKKTKNAISSSKDEVIDDLLPDNDENSPKNRKKAGWIIGSAGAVGLTALLFASGLRKNIYKGLQNLRSRFARKAHSKDKMSSKNNFYNRALAYVNRFLERADAINNGHSAKIIWIKKGMAAFSDKTPKNKFGKMLKKIYNSITDFFIKISRKTVMKSYKKTDKYMEKALSKVLKSKNKLTPAQLSEKITINGITKTRKEWFDLTISKQGKIQRIYNENFSEAASDLRYNQMLDSMADLDVRFWNASYNLKNLKNNVKGMTQSFVAQQLMATEKAKLIQNAASKRALITNDIADICSSINLALKDIDPLISLKDGETIKNLSKFKSHLNKIIKASAHGKEPERKDLISIMVSDINEIMSGIKTKPDLYSQELISKIGDKFSTAKQIAENSKSGEIQEILDIYKKIFPEKTFNKIAKSMRKYNRSLNKSINTECNAFFDKMRDFSMGAAPMDVLDIAFGIAPMAFFMARAKDKDKRISIGLKYGIPTIASIGTSLYCTTGLLSGGKALAFGLIVGFISNRICKYIDDIRLNAKQSANIVN